MTDKYILDAWDSGEKFRTEQRDRKRELRRHGMRVSGESVKVLATLVPKKRKPKRKRR